MKILSFFSIGIAGLVPWVASALNIEAESVLVKPEKLPLNESGARGWSLWSQDKNVKSWSGGVTIRNFKSGDCKPEEADQLHFSIPVKENGRYALFVQTVRNCGFSLDNGKTWRKINGKKALISSARFAAGDKISVIAANCFDTPENRGTVYIDCFQLEKLPDAVLQNGDFSRKKPNGEPVGWNVYKVRKTTANVIPGAVEMQSTGPGWSWLLINQTKIACAPFDRYLVTGKAKNSGNTKCTFQLQFVGMQGNRIVNHSVTVKSFTLAPGEEKNMSLEVVAPDQNLETLMFRIVGYPGCVQFRDFKLKELGNSLAFS